MVIINLIFINNILKKLRINLDIIVVRLKLELKHWLVTANLYFDLFY